MNIIKILDSTWNQIYHGAVAYGDSDIIPDQRVIIINRNVKKLIVGQLIMMFDEEYKIALVSSRICLEAFALPSYLHALCTAKKLERSGIHSNVEFSRGLVTCIYYKEGWLEQVVQQSRS